MHGMEPAQDTMDFLPSIDLDLARKLRDRETRRKFFIAEASAEIARQLVQLRKRRNLSQRRLASKVGMQQPRISQVERADYLNWSFNTLRRLAEAMDARIRVLIQPAEDVIGEYSAASGPLPVDAATAHGETFFRGPSEALPVNTVLAHAALTDTGSPYGFKGDRKQPSLLSNQYPTTERAAFPALGAGGVAQSIPIPEVPQPTGIGFGRLIFHQGVFDVMSRINQLGIYPDGLIATSRAHTELLDRFLDDLLSWAEEALGLVQTDVPPRERHYESNVIVGMDIREAKAFSFLTRVNSSLRGYQGAIRTAPVRVRFLGIAGR